LSLMTRRTVANGLQGRTSKKGEAGEKDDAEADRRIGRETNTLHSGRGEREIVRKSCPKDPIKVFGGAAEGKVRFLGEKMKLGWGS